MDAGTADAINRRDVTLIAARLDALDIKLADVVEAAWYDETFAEVLLSDDPSKRADRAWTVGILASGIPGIAFDGAPADCDWDNLFGYFRTAILERRTRTENPAPCESQSSPCGVV